MPVRTNAKTGETEFLLIQHLAGHWGFPKGHLEAGETPAVAALRELAEETDLRAVKLIREPVFIEEYSFINNASDHIQKKVTYFLGEIEGDTTVGIQPEEVQGFAWSNSSQTRKLITFDESRQLFDEVCAYLSLSVHLSL